jgi:hypothetical protein
MISVFLVVILAFWALKAAESVGKNRFFRAF